MNRFQIATYSQLLPDASGKGRLDILVKTKPPKVVLQSFEVTPQDLRATQTIYARAGQAMLSEHYMPNRLSMFCSRRHCAYWRISKTNGAGRFRRHEAPTEQSIPGLDSNTAVHRVWINPRH